MVFGEPYRTPQSARRSYQVVLSIAECLIFSMSMDAVKKTVALTFGVSLDEVTEASSSQTMPEWDSVGHMSLIMALEERFEMSFTVDEIMIMRDVATIRRILKSRCDGFESAGSAE